mmetsp:Transcript_17337/g.42352  ORF Transcript_17337/g.42352 Transcript_17337/m.42352 type:complete len:228 (-) Transcript_17337:438-1121(-)
MASVPRGGSTVGHPSVRIMRCESRVGHAAFSRVWIPSSRPAQRFVLSMGRRAASLVWHSARLEGVMGVRSHTTEALEQKTTRERRSCSPRLCITVRTPCLTMSRSDSPCDSTVPSLDCTLAVAHMEPLMSTTQQTSTAVRPAAPSGGATDTHESTSQKPSPSPTTACEVRTATAGTPSAGATETATPSASSSSVEAAERASGRCDSSQEEVSEEAVIRQEVALCEEP